jgi:16S rRNA U516 pseudouridylate synthase RsuA-like enzyme
LHENVALPSLVLLTDDGKLQARIADPHHRTKKTYLAQAERGLGRFP